MTEKNIPQDILDQAEEVKMNLLPRKSKIQYEREYGSFNTWKTTKHVKIVNEDVLLAYFSEKPKEMKSSSLWSKFSMLKSTLRAKEDVDIEKYYKLNAFLKQQSVGYEPKKSLILTREEINKFMAEAPDETYLLMKIVILFGIYGACRREELYNISVQDIQDKDDVLIITIPDTKINRKRVFTVTNEMDGTNPLELYRKYRALRPGHINHDKLFIYYKSNKCSIQRVGLHTLAKVPSEIAKYLKLPNAELYTGHCFRRSSANLLANAGADLTSIKRHGGWKSSTVAEGYLDDSLENKNKCAKLILNSEQKVVVERYEASTSTEISTSAGNSMSVPNEFSSGNQLDLHPSISDAGVVFKELTACTFNIYVNKPTLK